MTGGEKEGDRNQQRHDNTTTHSHCPEEKSGGRKTGRNGQLKETKGKSDYSFLHFLTP